MAGPRDLAGQREGQPGEPARIAIGQGTAAVVHGVEPAQEHAPDRRLDVVEAQVEADLGVDVLVHAPVIAKAPAAHRDVVVVRDEQPAVAHHGEVLRRVEREDARAPEAPHLAPLPGRSVRLGAVLEEPEAARRAELEHAGEIGGVPVEVNGHEAHRPRRHLGRGVLQVDGVGVVDVDEDRDGAGEADGLDGRKGGVRGDQHLVARLHAEGLERHPEGGRRARRQHGVLGAVVAGEFLLEGAALGTQDVLARVDGGQDRGLDLVIDGWAGQRNSHQQVPPKG